MSDLMNPTDRFYTCDHEWIKIEGDTARVGITDYAQTALGEVVYVELPGEGAAMAAEEPFGEVESVKSVSELFMPADGTIVEVNSVLEDSPGLINSDPYGEGWIIRVKFTDETLDGLLDVDAYRDICAG